MLRQSFATSIKNYFTARGLHTAEQKRNYILLAGAIAFLSVIGALVVWRATVALPNQHNLTVTQSEDVAEPAKTEASTDSTVEQKVEGATTVGGSSNSASSQTTIRVNNQNIDVPQNGSVHKEINDDGSKTTIDVTNNSDGSSSTYSSTTTTQTVINSSTHDVHQ